MALPGLIGFAYANDQQYFDVYIQMFCSENASPHFHALYAELEVEIDIRTLEERPGCQFELGAMTWYNGAVISPLGNMTKWRAANRGLSLLALAHSPDQAAERSAASRCGTSRSRIAWRLMLCLLAVLPQMTLAMPTGNVLVLYSDSRLLPANIEFDQSMMQELGERHDVKPIVFSEFLDMRMFHGTAYEHTFATHLNAKYASQPPSVIIAGGPEAFDFIVHQRKEFFPHTPVLYVAVPEQVLRRTGPLPPEYVGVPMRHDFIGTIEQGLKWRPKARHLLIVLGAGEFSSGWDQRLRKEAATFAGRLDIEFLVVESAAALRARLQGLSDDWLVFTPGFFADRQGGHYLPREAAQLIASASPVPVFGPY